MPCIGTCVRVCSKKIKGFLFRITISTFPDKGKDILYSIHPEHNAILAVLSHLC
jgi:hypothetical protein